jgi:hypothetical protein
MFKVTLISPSVEPAGTPAMFRLEVAAAPDPSGTTTAIVPDVAVIVDVVDEELTKRTAGSPRHMATELGVTVGAGGV